MMMVVVYSNVQRQRGMMLLSSVVVMLSLANLRGSGR